MINKIFIKNTQQFINPYCIGPGIISVEQVQGNTKHINQIKRDENAE